MGDAAIIIFWSLAYACMVIYSFIYRKEKKPFMPLIAGALNFGWEIHALITSGGNWGHIAWLTLDCFILVYNLYILAISKSGCLMQLRSQLVLLVYMEPFLLHPLMVC